ncbi:hypothetical protein CMV48_19990 [Escherichia coli]|nr:hypothetical protein CMV64_03880 [Escherichia coli]RJK12301.1 hypothetical protein CMV43_20610 [Escherichia coli]RJK14092.1 hypothetical protein CMV63_18350 [Escherichia coli]RJK24707.1 hypothetical protein CMV45_18920 [Escherichia coli]RJK32660.1 hypothetical protein CMV49_09635 [Escherichia coli]
MKSAFRFFNSCYSRFMSALDDASSSGCQYLLVEEIKTKKAAGCYPCGRFRAHIAIKQPDARFHLTSGYATS